MVRRSPWMGLVMTAVALLALLTACGGGGGGSSGGGGGSTVSGTASSGQPLSGSVALKDSAGTAAAPVAIGAGGRFVIPVDGLKPPFILRAEGRVNGESVALYSAGSAAGTLNVNPMTDLVLHVAAGAGNVDAAWNAPAANANVLGTARLSAATESVRKLLLPHLSAQGAAGSDPFTDEIQLGAGLDAVFDRLAIARDSAAGGVTFASRINGATLLNTTLAQIDQGTPTLPAPDDAGARPAVTLGWWGPAGMSFGKGYDDVSSGITGNCVAFNDVAQIKPQGTVIRRVSIELLEDSESITRHLNVSASAKIRVGLYSGSGAATFASDAARDSTSVFVAVYTEIIGYTFNLEGARILGKADGGTDWLDKYNNDVPRFRDSCGDRFLGAITTGGKMLGIMKITTSSEKEKTAVTANVKVKSALFNSGTASMRETMTSLKNQYAFNMSIFEMGPPDDAVPTSLESFMQALEDFPKKVNGCLTDWRTCAYMVTFVDYATLQPGSTNVVKQMEAMQTLIDNATAYDRVLQQISDMQARPELYESTTLDLVALSASITASKGLVDAAAQKCANYSNSCANVTGIVDVKTLNLPLRKPLVTHTCADYKTNFPSLTADGEYRMYLGSDTDLKNPFYLYCQDMTTDQPKEYLTLQRTSPLSTRPSYNFSSSVGHGDAFTVFTRLRVMVNTSDLAIVRDDFKYSTTTWVAKKDGAGNDDQTPYGQAKADYLGGDWVAEHQGHANIDLTDTPFAISNLTQWTMFTTVRNDTFSAWTANKCDGRPNCANQFVISPDRKSITMHIAGNPGYVQPVADVRLKLVP